MVMAGTMTPVQKMAAQYEEPEEILRRVNDALAVQNPRDMFVTLFCAVFDAHGRQMSYASAGHPSPVLLRAGELPRLPCVVPGLLAGVMPGTCYEGHTLDLCPGDVFVFY